VKLPINIVYHQYGSYEKGLEYIEDNEKYAIWTNETGFVHPDDMIKLVSLANIVHQARELLSEFCEIADENGDLEEEYQKCLIFMNKLQDVIGNN
jgi:hypothetical protein